jgi:hypothetical protein
MVGRGSWDPPPAPTSPHPEMNGRAANSRKGSKTPILYGLFGGVWHGRGVGEPLVL